MIYKRVAARLRAQDWVVITIELAIVIVGGIHRQLGGQLGFRPASRTRRRASF